MTRHVLVSGAGGFSGAELVMKLLVKGHQVTAITRSSRGRLPEQCNCDKNLQVLHADLSKPLSLPITVDAIFHAAARSPAMGISVDDLVRDNVLATRNLIEYANQGDVKLFVFFSSLSVHGEVRTAILDEATPIYNPTPYGLTKLLGEEMLKASSASMRSLAVRLPGIIGRNSTRNWLSCSLAAARAGEKIKIYNAEAPFNNAVHVADLCHFLSGLLDKNWDGYDVVSLGAGGQLSVGTVARFLSEETACGSQVIIEETNRTSFRISSARAQTSYGYQPTDVTEMLRRFVRENSIC